MHSVPCSLTGPCPGPIPIKDIGSDCGNAAADLTQSLADLGFNLTASHFALLSASYFCIPAVRAALQTLGSFPVSLADTVPISPTVSGEA